MWKFTVFRHRISENFHHIGNAHQNILSALLLIEHSTLWMYLTSYNPSTSSSSKYITWWCHIPEIWTQNNIYIQDLQTKVKTQLTKYNYGLSLCLWTYKYAYTPTCVLPT